MIHYCKVLFCNPSRDVKEGGMKTNRRTRAESQWIVGQAYSRTYNTLSRLSRLQTICINNNSKLRFGAKSAPFTATELAPLFWIWALLPIVFHLLSIETLLSSMDSDLEAFSHNPTDDSFGALAVQLTPLPNIWTTCSSRTRMDYCRDNELISRVKLTCLTTV